MERIAITVHTDGSCLGNPGPGGWAAILVAPNGYEKVLRGGCKETTNNRMELTAVIEAVRQCKTPCDITIMTDSQYVMISREKWTKWNRKANLPNRDLWEKLIEAGHTGQHFIKFQHVLGHSGEVYNERCDKIAREQALKAKRGDLL